ncbi:putative formate/nitrite transporter [Exidia glandulosa HHB12029]|uniref:Putative formate/nitrite transporter n=1 Tax=Exidia glandulosa HHB12029 TaxID=1314781 RepID=A0A165KG97_EXIGL|nr:putative formate/nitrite transporter [Exidia glandulosa HHB12029]
MSTMSSTHAPADVAVMMVEASVAKHRTRPEVLLLKAFNAGILLSFGGLLSVIMGGGSPTLTKSDPGIVKILSGFVFPVGLVMIVLQGQELLTSNMMVFPMGVWKRAVPWWSLPYNWFIVFWGNLAGSLFFAALLAKFSGVVSADPYLSYIQAAATKKAIDPTWAQIYLRGIGCNWLVCIAVWQGMTAKEVVSKIFAIWFPIWVFVACSFDHVIANMFSLPLAIMMGGELTTAEYIKKSLFASLFGNITGALFVCVPFTYFWLRDYTYGGALAQAEAGAMPSRDSPDASGSIRSRVEVKEA